MSLRTSGAVHWLTDVYSPIIPAQRTHHSIGERPAPAAEPSLVRHVALLAACFLLMIAVLAVAGAVLQH